jgi:hypothetical protein
MVAISVTFDRTVLSLADLTITGTPGGDFWLPEDGVEWPRFPRRKDRAPASRYLSGPGALLGRVADLGTFPLPVYVGGDTSAEVETNKAIIQAAVDQWSYELTLTVDGAAQVFTAECVDDEIAWGEIDSGMVRAHICRGSVAIPLYPGSS